MTAQVFLLGLCQHKIALAERIFVITLGFLCGKQVNFDHQEQLEIKLLPLKDRISI